MKKGLLMFCDGSVASLTSPQQEIAGLMGASESTIRAIEGGRLPLSAKFAHRLSTQTGIRARWFLGDQLEDPSPDPIEVRKRFSEAQEGLPSAVERSEYIEGNFPDGYMATLIPMAVLLRLLILQRLIARELGYSGCRHTGFFDMVVKMNLRLLGRVPIPGTAPGCLRNRRISLAWAWRRSRAWSWAIVRESCPLFARSRPTASNRVANRFDFTPQIPRWRKR